jgi:threonine/homoserine/homoserine lactone efflux protein
MSERSVVNLFGFIFTAVAISLSGVMAPGPITAATFSAGSRWRHAGAVIGLGHIAVELPLIVLLVAGAGTFFQSVAMRTGIGLAGGLFLLLMGGQTLLSLRTDNPNADAPVQRHPFWTGVILSGANPYFLVWWATVGLTLTTSAMEYGLAALILFAIVHWLCDVGWLEILSVAGFKGSQCFGRKSQTTIAVVCALIFIGFGLSFVWDAMGT